MVLGALCGPCDAVLDVLSDDAFIRLGWGTDPKRVPRLHKKNKGLRSLVPLDGINPRRELAWPKGGNDCFREFRSACFAAHVRGGVLSLAVNFVERVFNSACGSPFAEVVQHHDAA